MVLIVLVFCGLVVWVLEQNHQSDIKYERKVQRELERLREKINK